MTRAGKMDHPDKLPPRLASKFTARYSVHIPPKPIPESVLRRHRKIKASKPPPRLDAAAERNILAILHSLEVHPKWAGRFVHDLAFKLGCADYVAGLSSEKEDEQRLQDLACAERCLTKMSAIPPATWDLLRTYLVQWFAPQLFDPNPKIENKTLQHWDQMGECSVASGALLTPKAFQIMAKCVRTILGKERAPKGRGPSTDTALHWIRWLSEAWRGLGLRPRASRHSRFYRVVKIVLKEAGEERGDYYRLCQKAIALDAKPRAASTDPIMRTVRRAISLKKKREASERRRHDAR